MTQNGEKLRGEADKIYRPLLFDDIKIHAK